MTAISRWTDRLFEHTDARALALLRILMGGLLFYEMSYYHSIRLVDMGLVGPKVLFPYEGFTWVRPFGKAAMDAILATMAFSRLAIAAGLLYRVATVLFFAGFTYVLLLDRCIYNNHFYLFALLAFLFTLIPAHRAWSLDRLLFKARMTSTTVPRWCWWALRLQVVIVYFYGGIAKMNPDWLVHMQPMRSALEAAARGGALEGLLTSMPVVAFFTYGGLLFDLAVGPLLWWKRSRRYILPFVLLFNLTNHLLFDDIGVFPFFMIAATILFFDPEEVAAFLDRRGVRSGGAPSAPASPAVRGTVLALLAGYFTFQLLFPLRWLLLPGDVDWTSIGQRFSWRMKVSTRDPLRIAYFVHDEQGNKRPVALDRFINNMQANVSAYDPRVAVRFARWMKEEMARRGFPNVRVTSEIIIRHNGRPARYLFPPDEDLAAIQPDLGHPERWVPPLEPGPEHRVPPSELERIRREAAIPARRPVRAR
ncbi:MAG: HTTM domain-containing protein [Flavobacteriales bacterium]|nr:HTTM domain-containing protein [Flavobacteriales bacterium]